MESATVARDLAFNVMPLDAGGRVLTGEAEYASNYISFLQARQRLGITIEAVSSDASGQIDVAALEGLIDERVKLIAVAHVPTDGGLVNLAEELGRVARKYGIPFLLDAC